MQVKTNEATGRVLDWLVAKAEEPIGGYKAWVQADFDKGIPVAGIRADDWLTGGPIIEREKIAVDILAFNDQWTACKKQPAFTPACRMSGPTPLIAAMRCFVASKLGDEVEVPDELAQ